MIIVDYSQTVKSNIFMFEKDILSNSKNGRDKDTENIVRHLILSSIKGYKKKYGAEYGEVVIAVDSDSYWRKDVFPNYKVNRKKIRDASPLDWKLIYKIMDQVADDLKAHFPYKVVEVSKAEADDVIAVLTKWVQTNRTRQVGVIEEVESVLILSSDKDFKQLHKYGNVRQWAPAQKKFVERDDNYLLEHIACGDIGDSVPSVLCPDDFFIDVDSGRAPPVTAKVKALFADRDQLNDAQKARYDRNNRLVNFDFIPKDIEQAIINEYLTVEVRQDKMGIYNYLVDNRCRLLLDEIEEF